MLSKRSLLVLHAAAYTPSLITSLTRSPDIFMRLSCDWKIAAIDCISALSLLTELDLNSNYGTTARGQFQASCPRSRYCGTSAPIKIGSATTSCLRLSFGIGERASNALGVHACDSQPLSF